MFTKHRVLVAAIVLIFALGITPLAAQIDSFTSNTSMATDGLFTTDVDDFLSVTNWENVEFNNFFSAFQWEGSAKKAPSAENEFGAGFAVNTGPVYLGVGYYGRFWGRSVNTTTKENGAKTVDHSADLSWTSKLSILAGTAPVGGILLDADFAGFGNNNNDKESTDTQSTIGLGSVELGIGWGKKFDVNGGLIVKPDLGFHYNINTQKTTSKTGSDAEMISLNGLDPFFSNADYKSDINNGQVGITGIISAHGGIGIDFPVGGNDYSVWAGYDLSNHLYDKQLTFDNYWEDYKPSFTDHLINVGVGGWYDLDRRLSFAWTVGADVYLANAEITSKYTQTNDPVSHKFTESIFVVTPEIAAGVVFKAIPGKFNFNGSAALYPIGDGFIQRKLTHNDQSIMSVKTTETNTTIGKLIEPSSGSNYYVGAYTVTSLGITWFVINGFAIDAAASVGISTARLDLTALSVLLSFKR